jgi:hypothetical protein
MMTLDQIPDKRQITSRFRGVCARCRQPIAKDVPIWHSKILKKAWHLACDAAPTTTTSGETSMTFENGQAVPPTQAPVPVHEHEAPKRAPKERAAQKHATADNAADVAQAIAQALSMLKLNAPTLDEAAVRRIAEDVLRDAAMPKRIEVAFADKPLVDVGVQHSAFPTLLKVLAIPNINVWLVGPTASGKTTAVEHAAKALGLVYYFNGAIDTEYKLTGFVDAQGRIVRTQFRDAYERGGVYLFDEVDASMPAALLAFNASLANGYADFPGGAIPRHPDFRCVAAANTWGLGADADYIGRNKMDAAFLNRFVRVAWPYDEGFERALAGNDDWTSYVQGCRVKARAKGLKVVISPRASIYGAQLLAAGFDRAAVAEMTVFAGLPAEQRAHLS